MSYWIKFHRINIWNIKTKKFISQIFKISNLEQKTLISLKIDKLKYLILIIKSKKFISEDNLLYSQFI
jgi:hypothetical protein